MPHRRPGLPDPRREPRPGKVAHQFTSAGARAGPGTAPKSGCGDENPYPSWTNLGTIAAQRQDWPTALPCYRRAVGLEPRSDDAECNLGGVLLALGDFDEARTHLERALSLNPRNMSALQNTTALLFHLGDFAGARDLNRRLLEIDPRSQAVLRMRDRLDEVGRRASP